MPGHRTAETPPGEHTGPKPRPLQPNTQEARAMCVSPAGRRLRPLGWRTVLAVGFAAGRDGGVLALLLTRGAGWSSAMSLSEAAKASQRPGQKLSIFSHVPASLRWRRGSVNCLNCWGGAPPH